MRKKFSREELCDLVEVEPSPAEELDHLYREWKQAELKELWVELKRVEDAYLRRMKNRKHYVERVIGVRLKARVPKAVITPPMGIAQKLEQIR